jgi:hypothetical protein
MPTINTRNCSTNLNTFVKRLKRGKIGEDIIFNMLTENGIHVTRVGGRNADEGDLHIPIFNEKMQKIIKLEIKNTTFISVDSATKFEGDYFIQKFDSTYKCGKVKWFVTKSEVIKDYFKQGNQCEFDTAPSGDKGFYFKKPLKESIGIENFIECLKMIFEVTK